MESKRGKLLNPLFFDMLQYPWEVHFVVYDWATLLIIDYARHTNIFNSKHIFYSDPH